jgi:hypothetical protein
LNLVSGYFISAKKKKNEKKRLKILITENYVGISSSSSSIGTKTLRWVSTCSTIVEHSQQEGFYRVPLPAARQTPN